MMPLRLARFYPLSHSFLPPHAVGRGLEPLGNTLVMGRADGIYFAAASGTAVPVPPPYSPAHAVVYSYVLRPSTD